MDIQLLAGIERICTLPETQLKDELGKLLKGQSRAASLSVRTARDSFTKLLARTREGSVELVGRDHGDQAVVLSITALANVIKAAAGGISAGEFLAATNFRPSSGRIVHEETDDDSCAEFVVNTTERYRQIEA